jgi:uncharacterized protein YfcZ (UPF0381/DUF406 family)
VTMDRDDFVKMMIAELSRQQEEDKVAFEAPRPKTAVEVFQKMCFDFPEALSDLELRGLSNEIQAMILKETCLSTSSTSGEKAKKSHESPKLQDFASIFTLCKKFVENVLHMSSSFHAIGVDDVQVSTVGTCYLASTLFLMFPFALLHYDRRRLGAIFADAPVQEEDDWLSSDGNSKDASTIMSWSTIIERFEKIVLSSNASMLLGISHDVEARKKCLEHLISTMKLLSSVGSDELETSDISASKTKVKSSKVKFNTLLTELRKAAKSCESIEDAQGHDVSSTAKRVYVHLALVTKDALLRLPGELSTFLPELLAVIVPSSAVQAMQVDPRAHIFGPKSFPSAEECLFVVICAQLSAAALSAKQHVVAIRTRLKAEEIASFSFLVTCLTDRLNYLVSLIERMMHHSEEDLSEPLGHLCDLVDLCVLEDFTANPGLVHSSELKRRRTKLILNWERALSVLVVEVAKILVSRIKTSVSLGGSNCSSTCPSSVVTSRACTTAFAAMFQSKTMADAMMRHLLSSIRLAELSLIYIDSAIPFLALLISLLNSTVLSIDKESEDVVLDSVSRYFQYCIDCLREYRSAIQSSTDLQCLGEVDLVLGNKARNMALGLLNSLSLLTVEFIGLDAWVKFCETFNDRYVSSMGTFGDIFDMLYEELGGLQLAHCEMPLSDLHSDPSVKKDNVLTKHQVDTLRLYTKKLKTYFTDDPLTSDKTD